MQGLPSYQTCLYYLTYLYYTMFLHGCPFADWLKIVLQIKICAEYRDMIPRPRLVCQEPGLRPIGQSPGVPDKSSRGLGSMSRYSAQILICFIAYIFLFFFIPLWLWLGTLQDCQDSTVPSAIVHCNQNESSDNQSSQHGLLRCSWPIKTLYVAFRSQPGENDRWNGWNLYQ